MASLRRASSFSPIPSFLHRSTAVCGGANRPETHFVCRFTSSQSALSNFRLRSSDRLYLKQKLFRAFASNSNSSKRSYGTEDSNVPQGPPLLTILAGLLVFFVLCWIIGTIVMWLVSLIINLPLSK